MKKRKPQGYAHTGFIGDYDGEYRLPGTEDNGSSSDGTSGTNSRAKRKPPTAGDSAAEAAGIRAGEIIAYRAWKVSHHGLLIRSLIVPYVWDPGINTSPAGTYCNISEWSGSYESHYEKEGFYSYKNLKEAYFDQICGSSYFSSDHKYMALGVIAIWGTVYEHTKGFRSSHAKILKITSLYDGVKTFASLPIPVNKQLRKQLNAKYCP